MAEFAFQFWERVDDLKGDRTLKEIAEEIGISYATLKDMRSRNRFPKQNVTVALSYALNTTVDFLMKGTTENMDDKLIPEMVFVRDNPEARQLIRAIMEDPSILPLVSALAKKAVASLKERNVEGL